MSKDYFINRILPIIFIASGLYTWITIVFGTIQLFGDGLISSIIGWPVVCLNCYVYAKAYIYIVEEYEKEIERTNKKKP